MGVSVLLVLVVVVVVIVNRIDDVDVRPFVITGGCVAHRNTTLPGRAGRP